MKIVLKIIFITLILTSCKSKKAYFPDYSGDAYRAISIVKNEIISDETSIFEVKIRNSHGGYFQVNSVILKLNDSIILKNHINNAFRGIESDSTLIFPKDVFIQKLDYELKIAQRQVKIAGNYQTIVIITEDTSQTFYTRQGLGLMRILQKGEHMLTIKE